MNILDGNMVARNTRTDPALCLLTHQHRARHVALVLCRIQQRLESQLLVNAGIQGLTESEASGSRLGDRSAQIGDWQAVDESAEYAIAREAEVLAVTEELRFLDSIPEIKATSLAGVIAKLEMIVGADREIDSPDDFPWPHLASVLRDLKAIAGDAPADRPERSLVRADIARHWKAAAKLVAALKEENAREQLEQAG